MAWNGSGVFLRLYNWVADRDASIKIMATRMDGEFDNYATGMNNCLTLDGQNSPAVNISWNSKKITNLATPTLPADAVTKAYVDAVPGALTLVQAFSPLTTVPTGAGSYTTFTGYTETASPLDPNSEFNVATGVFTAAKRGVYRFHVDIELLRNGATIAAGQRVQYGISPSAGSSVTTGGAIQADGIEVAFATFATDKTSTEFVISMNASATQLVWVGSAAGVTYTGGPVQVTVRSLVIEALYYY